MSKKLVNKKLDDNVMDSIITAFIEGCNRKQMSDDIINDCISRFIINRVYNDNHEELNDSGFFYGVNDFKEYIEDWLTTGGDELRERAAEMVDDIDCNRWINDNYTPEELVHKALNGEDVLEVWSEACEACADSYFDDLDNDAAFLVSKLSEYNSDPLRLVEFDNDCDEFRIVFWFLRSEEFKEVEARLYTVGYNYDIEQVAKWLYRNTITTLKEEV